MKKTWNEKSSRFWENERARRMLALFHRAAKNVPAYKDFLKKQRVEPEKIKTLGDFQLVPPVNKKDYLRHYPFKKLIWEGRLPRGTNVWTATSGSTSTPFYFPRTEVLDRQYSEITEMFLRNSSRGKGPTLVIIGFGMGVWIGGLITYKAFEIAGNRIGRHVSILTPGINKQEIFNAFSVLSPHFTQTIFIGYPPFVKDTLEEAAAQGINIKALNLRLFFAAESFTESFRGHLAMIAGIKNTYRDTLNIYGTADLGAMAFETPFSIFTRQRALEEKPLFASLFSDIEKTPTLAQYNPAAINFESIDGDITITGDNTIPLIRYSIGDHGGVLSAREVRARLSEYHLDDRVIRRSTEIDPLQLPFVYVYERSDFSTKLYGAIIYPEHVKEGLGAPLLSNIITGRFTMATKFNAAHDEYLEINVETKPRAKLNAVARRSINKHIIESLLRHNAEYRNNYQSIPKKVTPSVVFWEYENPVYFKPGIKQKWVVKTNQ